MKTLVRWFYPEQFQFLPEVKSFKSQQTVITVIDGRWRFVFKKKGTFFLSLFVLRFKPIVEDFIESLLIKLV